MKIDMVNALCAFYRQYVFSSLRIDWMMLFLWSNSRWQTTCGK